MAESRELQIVLTMREELGKKLDLIQKSLKQTNTDVEKTNLTFQKFASSVAALVSVGAIVGFAKQSVKSASEMQQAFTRLDQVLRTTTGATKETVEGLYEQAQALERVGVISAHSILMGQGQLATFDLQAASIKQLTPALLNLVVAEKGVNVSMEDVKNTANGLGKALQGQTDMLVKQGFKFTEAQMELLKTGSETERVTALTEILNSTYEDMNETMAQTFEGRMIQAQNAIDNLRQGIGQALISGALEPLLRILMDNANGFALTEQRVNAWGLSLYKATNYVVGTAKLISMLIKSLTFLGDAFVSIGKIGFSFAKDIVTNFKNMGKTVGNIISGIGKAFKGDFDGALKTFNSVIDTTFKNTSVSMSELGDKANSWAMVMADTWESVGRSADAMMGAGFKSATNTVATSMNTVNNAVKNSSGKSKEELEKIKNALEDMGESYSGVQQKADDALFELSQSHEKNLASIRLDIAQTEKSISDLLNSYSREKEQDTKNVAEEVLRTEGRVNEIQKELAGELSQKRRKELEDELAKHQLALTTNAEFIKSIDSSIVEARRRAGLSDLARAIEDFNAKQALAQQELDEKLKSLNIELEALRQKEREEQLLFRQKQEYINNLMSEASKHYADVSANNLKITKEFIEQEIDLYKRLAEAISRVRGSNTAEFQRLTMQVRSVNDAIISPQGEIITTHPDDYLIATKNPGSLMGGGVTVIVNGDVSGNELVDKVQRALAKNLRLQGRMAL